MDVHSVVVKLQYGTPGAVTSAVVVPEAVDLRNFAASGIEEQVKNTSCPALP